MKRDYLFGEPRDVLKLTLATVSELSGIPVPDIMGPARRGEPVRAKHAAMYLVRKAGKSTPQIGCWFKRDHSTVCRGA